MLAEETLLNRVREIIEVTHDNVGEKKAFGGICFMVNDKMCVAVKPERIMVRIDPEKNDDVISKNGCEPMVHNGKVMRGFVFVSSAELQSKKQLEYWVKLALDYNPVAKQSKKKVKKSNN
ncbi:TfoX/Sxy family protein [Panacibacter ginsenosidivorans]|uniref:TfoX/Sxy family protein n=1 Tax=Panacibacter ginsenosidivorans TaxID=1813871 RepID=A0A5B8VG03_9BACT|nr:TfoX/Sxy family protein [Panacibacter ginsenosidivorans]QEC70021.1 TfoX/Sxy family protein [Panacibacter ginsenosidivorans]